MKYPSCALAFLADGIAVLLASVLPIGIASVNKLIIIIKCEL